MARTEHDAYLLVAEALREYGEYLLRRKKELAEKEQKNEERVLTNEVHTV